MGVKSEKGGKAMIVRKEGHFSIRKDGSSYYRVYRKRTRVGSFLHLRRATNYLEERLRREHEEYPNKLLKQCLNGVI